MVKNDVIVVVYLVLDYRRIIDVFGYERVNLYLVIRFIGIMNYEYVGIKEFNEVLVFRFMVIDIFFIEEDKLMMILKNEFLDVDEEKLIYFVGIFLDL